MTAQKSIFITGAGRGIGKATAQLFAQKGWFIGLCDINQMELEALANGLGQSNCSVHLADVRKVEEVEKAVNAFGDKTNGQMHVLFNNAGILYSGGFENLSLEKHRAIVEVNFIGQMNVTHCALPLLKATPNSTVITMGSASAIYGNPELTAYAATKSAVQSLTEGWNLLFKKHGIHVTDINPAYVRTAMVSDVQEAMALPDKEVKLSTERIAQAVWKAAYSKKVHHYIGGDAQLFRWAKKLLPHSIFLAILKRVAYQEALQKN
ncbi:MAG: SDR family oxidoreductase [Bacteroidota bacterium]